MPAPWQPCPSTAFTALLLLLLVLPPWPAQAAAKTDVVCTAAIFTSRDWGSECISEVQRVRQYCGGPTIHFLVTLHFLHLPSIFAPTGFCVVNATRHCVAPTPALVSTLASSLGACFRAAAALNFTNFQVTPHLDDGGTALGNVPPTIGGLWRNALNFRPLLPYGSSNFSYYNLVLKPIALALQPLLAAQRSLTTHLSMQGEMAFTVVSYPQDWQQVRQGLRALLPTTKLGVCFPSQDLCGHRSCKHGQVNAANLLSLLSALDFVGISCYHPTSVLPALPEFQGCAAWFDAELALAGVKFSSLRARPGFEFHYSEIGVGGGTCGALDCPAPNATMAAEYPSLGVGWGWTGAYNASIDPWKKPALAAFRQGWYRQLLRWAQNGTGPVYRVDRILLWMVASWDVAGIYATPDNGEAAYRDTAICTSLRSWSDHGVVL